MPPASLSRSAMSGHVAKRLPAPPIFKPPVLSPSLGCSLFWILNCQHQGTAEPLLPLNKKALPSPVLCGALNQVRGRHSSSLGSLPARPPRLGEGPEAPLTGTAGPLPPPSAAGHPMCRGAPPGACSSHRFSPVGITFPVQMGLLGERPSSQANICVMRMTPTLCWPSRQPAGSSAPLQAQLQGHCSPSAGALRPNPQTHLAGSPGFNQSCASLWAKCRHSHQCLRCSVG